MQVQQAQRCKATRQGTELTRELNVQVQQEGVAQARLTGELHGMQARWHSGPEQHKGVEGGQKIFPSAQLEHSPRRRRGIRTLHVKIATAQDAML